MSKLPYTVVTDRSGKMCKFATFERAERCARALVAASKADKFPDRAEIWLNFLTVAKVGMDGNERIWTDMEDSG
jgi:hypothetical protein